MSMQKAPMSIKRILWWSFLIIVGIFFLKQWMEGMPIELRWIVMIFLILSIRDILNSSDFRDAVKAIEEKYDEKFFGITQKLSNIERKLDDIEANTISFSSDNLQYSIDSLGNDIRSLESNLEHMNNMIEGMKHEIASLKSNLKTNW